MTKAIEDAILEFFQLNSKEEFNKETTGLSFDELFAEIYAEIDSANETEKLRLMAIGAMIA